MMADIIKSNKDALKELEELEEELERSRISQEIAQRITELGYRKLPKDKVILDKDLAYQIFAQICGIRMREPTDYRSALDDSYDRLKAILQ